MFEKLNSAKKAEKVKLRRAVGRNIADVDTDTMAAFYGSVYCNHTLEERAFYLACLYCEQDGNGTAELPVAWASYAAKHDIPHSTITRLIDSPWNDGIALSLVRIIRRMISEGYSIDFEKRMYDVKDWNTEKTRKQWAKKISKSEENENEKKD